VRWSQHNFFTVITFSFYHFCPHAGTVAWYRHPRSEQVLKEWWDASMDSYDTNPIKRYVRYTCFVLAPPTIGSHLHQLMTPLSQCITFISMIFTFHMLTVLYYVLITQEIPSEVALGAGPTDGRL